MLCNHIVADDFDRIHSDAIFVGALKVKYENEPIHDIVILLLYHLVSYLIVLIPDPCRLSFFDIYRKTLS